MLPTTRFSVEELAHAGVLRSGHLSEPMAKQVVRTFGVSVPTGQFVEDLSGLREATLSLRAPLVLKIVSPDVVHKSDVGAVRLGLMDGGTVVDAARSMLADPRIRSARIEGFLVEEMAHGSVEMALGGVVDPVFGPVVMIGLGGIFLEVFDDVSFRIVPASEHDIRAMLEELRSLPILQGTRGRPPVELDQVVETALAVGGRGGLLDTYREVIVELDINPLLVGDGPPVAADVRIVTVPQPEDKERMPRGSETV